MDIKLDFELSAGDFKRFNKKVIESQMIRLLKKMIPVIIILVVLAVINDIISNADIDPEVLQSSGYSDLDSYDFSAWIAGGFFFVVLYSAMIYKVMYQIQLRLLNQKLNDKYLGDVKCQLTNDFFTYSDYERELKFNWTKRIAFKDFDDFIFISNGYTTFDIAQMIIPKKSFDKDSLDELTSFLKSKMDKIK